MTEGETALSPGPADLREDLHDGQDLPSEDGG